MGKEGKIVFCDGCGAKNIHGTLVLERKSENPLELIKNLWGNHNHVTYDLCPNCYRAISIDLLEQTSATLKKLHHYLLNRPKA